MDKKLYNLGNEVNEYIVSAQAALAGYNFYEGNNEGKATLADIDKIRDLLNKAEHLSRLLTNQAMVQGINS